ncbi:WecB/TagA/CpsF family glycosyltransferase [Nioella nitratireducens]|uniref:WecB/TagA/CpsF family glycosyltransferase n=1 Tax=Nioella nitratireducens TaxID=1287720 RepID=UPI0008FD62CB|nr:WecB/TagA/CpsF family glycosyltransferase [Nioella nitratireducens]
MEFQAGDHRVWVTVTGWPQLQEKVRERFRAGQGFALATLNLDHLTKLRTPGPFRDAYAAQDFVTADGNPIVWCARLADQPVELLPGSDLILPLCRLAVEENVPLGLVGSTEDSLTGAADALRLRVPGLRIVSKVAPPMGFDPASAAADQILLGLSYAGVRLCFLALGAPKQEILAARGRAVVPEIGFASIGAGLDFLSGQQTRAPKWVRAVAMEWLWRLLSNPKRLATRYAMAFRDLPGHLWRSWRLR